MEHRQSKCMGRSVRRLSHLTFPMSSHREGKNSEPGNAVVFWAAGIEYRPLQSEIGLYKHKPRSTHWFYQTWQPLSMFSASKIKPCPYQPWFVLKWIVLARTAIRVICSKIVSICSSNAWNSCIHFIISCLVGWSKRIQNWKSSSKCCSSLVCVLS